MSVYIYKISGKVKNMILTKEAFESLGYETVKGISSNLFSEIFDDSLNLKSLVNRLQKRNLSDVEYVIFGDYGEGKHSFEFRKGEVVFFDTPFYTYQGQVGFMKKIKYKYYACPYFALFKRDNKWSKGVVEDIQIKRGKVISYTLSFGEFLADSPMFNRHGKITIKPENVNFLFGFVSHTDKTWIISENEVNRSVLNKKLKKIKE